MNLKLIMGIIGMSIIIISATGYLASITDKYDSSINMTGFNKTEKRLVEIHNTSSNVYSDLNTKASKESTVSDIFWAFKIGRSAIQTIWANFGLFTTMIGESFSIIAGEGLVPASAAAWLLLSIISIFFISVIIWLVSIFMKWYV